MLTSSDCVSVGGSASVDLMMASTMEGVIVRSTMAIIKGTGKLCYVERKEIS